MYEDEVDVQYQIVEEGTNRRKVKLVDSLGYSYNVKERGKSTVYWQCTVRPKGTYCKATVKECPAGVFTLGKNGHNHSAQVTMIMLLMLVSKQL
jgi:hypothetical protein